jgi:hypothetical protein
MYKILLVLFLIPIFGFAQNVEQIREMFINKPVYINSLPNKEIQFGTQNGQGNNPDVDPMDLIFQRLAVRRFIFSKSTTLWQFSGGIYYPGW